ncbi:MAG: hypothetical protein H7Y36_11205 [Armatimonadetes bacterium]|nr:hypothetical protein [Akkermansiaceae bacterium]
MKIKMSWARTAAMIASLLVASGDEGWAGEFIRVKESEEDARLQTAIFGYEKDGVRVDLIGAIHLADKKYYQFLNQYFEKYEVLLFEMVGGERLGAGMERAEAADEANKVEEADKLAGLRHLYLSMESALGLTGQSSWIDYTKENFIHADLTMAEFEALQKEKGESLLSIMLQASIAAERPSRQPNSLKLMRGILTGRPDLVKLEMMHTMADGDKHIDSLAGENVIIGDRNAKCFEVMDREISSGRKRLGIFYGAAHFPDMEERLEKKGFKKVSAKWLTAWRVRKN